MGTWMAEQSAANSSSQTRPVWWRDWQRLWGCHPGHAQAWLVVPLGGGSRQAANPCRGFGVWQQWLRRPEINFPAAPALCCFASLHGWHKLWKRPGEGRAPVTVNARQDRVPAALCPGHAVVFLRSSALSSWKWGACPQVTHVNFLVCQ